jgi:glycosyltransferase involved in cell wall biosynthesis
MLELARRDGSIEITGQVDDVLPFFDRADVFVCPVRMGGGFRGKVLEAMACGLPVVSTPLGAEGLPARDGENILLAATTRELADRTAALLEDSGLRRKIGMTGRNLMVEQFSWQSGVRKLEAVLADVVSG